MTNSLGENTSKMTYAVIFEDNLNPKKLLDDVRHLSETLNDECPQLMQFAEYMNKYLSIGKEDKMPTLPLYIDIIPVMFQCLAFLLIKYRGQEMIHQTALDDTVRKFQQKIHEVRTSFIKSLQSEINLLFEKEELTEQIEQLKQNVNN